MDLTYQASLAFALKPLPSKERKTTRELAILIDGNTVWPVPGEPGVGLEIQIDDLLAYLTEFWKPLMLRQVYPIDVRPSRPSELRRDAENRWAEQPPEIVEREEVVVSDFEEAHNLSNAFGGLFDLPPFWLLRSGDQMLCEAGGRTWRIPFGEARQALTAVGDAICAQLLRANAARWTAAAEAWQGRNRGEKSALLAWSTGISLAAVTELIDDGTLDPPQDFEDAANDNDELRIAARMAGALPLEQIRRIITLARDFKKHDSEDLKRLAQECIERVNSLSDKRPFAQGEEAARLARDWLAVPRDVSADIFALVAKLGVTIEVLKTDPSTLDALAIWGDRHGPGALLNAASTRVLPDNIVDVTLSPGARVTLAHELCHLLLDGAHAVSAIDVLRSRMPLSVEQRAKAFAGEFLLPTKAAADAWFEAGRPRGRAELEKVVSALAQQFGVTWSVASWKVEHGAAPYDIDLTPILDAIAPWR
jgi:hypothetical protein